MPITKLHPGILLFGLFTCLSAQAQFEDVTIRSTQISGPVYMLEGRGGNLAVLIGEDGVILVDDQYAPLTDKIMAAIRELSDKPVRFVINTHWHGDHVGGNEQLAGTGSVVVAHEKVRQRMSTEQFLKIMDKTVPPSPAAALPLVTFNDRVSFHLNGETVTAYHVTRGHTDGDAIIQFLESNVIHMGDIFFNGRYPFVDLGSGGSVQGMINAVQFGLGLCNLKTKVIAGHGPLGSCAELEDYGEMLNDAVSRIQALMDQGKTLPEIIEARPTADYDEKFGQNWIKPDQFTGFVYNSLLED
jgi:glyoxylase-like metal-dependent hydrolase (beta-lactamase superfamily II)